MADTAPTKGLFGLVQKAVLGDFNESNHFLDMSSNLVSAFTPMITTGLGIYILLQAYHYYGKGVDESILDISRRMIGWILIAMLCLNADNYIYMAKLIYQAPETVASVLTGKNFSANVLDTYWIASEQEYANLATLVDGFGIDDIFRALMCVILLVFFKICTFVLLGLIFIFYIMTKLALLLTLVVGPIFVACLFFPATRQWGMNWINQCGNYIITVTLYVGLMAIQTKVFETFIKGIFAVDSNGTLTKKSWWCLKMACDVVDATAVTALMFSALPVFLLTTVLCVIMALSIPNISNALLGGNSGAGISGRMAATAGTILTGGAKAVAGKLLQGVMKKG